MHLEEYAIRGLSGHSVEYPSKIFCKETSERDGEQDGFGDRDRDFVTSEVIVSISVDRYNRTTA